MARPKPSKNLPARIKEAAGRVTRQAGRSGEEADPERIARAADRATREVADLVAEQLEERWERATGSDAARRALAPLRPDRDAAAGVRRRLERHLEPFNEELLHFESEKARFARLLRAAPEAADRKGRGWTWLFVLLGSLILGPVGPPIVLVLAFAGGYLGGRSVRRQLDAERARLDRALDDLLDAWDAAAAGLRDSSRALAERYAAGLEKAGRHLEHRRSRPRAVSGRTDLPLALPHYPPPQED
jgi:hypothetical protein